MHNILSNISSIRDISYANKVNKNIKNWSIIAKLAKPKK